MRRFILGTALVLALSMMVIAACTAGLHSRPGGPLLPPADQKNEWVVLHLQPDAGNANDCILEQHRPADIHAVPGSWIRWVLVGECHADVGISARFTGPNGEEVEVVPADLQAENEKDKAKGLKEIDIDPDQRRDTEREQFKIRFQRHKRLVIKIRQDIPPRGTYRYQIFIDDKAARSRSLAERGVMRICPEWPCSK
jgi:hypothetical protein